MRTAHAEAKERLITGGTGQRPDDDPGQHSEKRVFQDEPPVVIRRAKLAPGEQPFHPLSPAIDRALENY